jgi:hypothetical protein
MEQATLPATIRFVFAGAITYLCEIASHTIKECGFRSTLDLTVTLVLSSIVIVAAHHIKRRLKEHCLWRESTFEYTYTTLALGCASDLSRISMSNGLQPSIGPLLDQPHIGKVHGILALGYHAEIGL